MKHVKLDRIDHKILSNLQQDGRMTNVALAKKVGISAPPCLRRVRALEEAGYITSYHAVLSPEKLGYGATVMIQVTLASHKETDLAAFEETVRAWPMVRECYLLLGGADYLLKVVVESLASYDDFLEKNLTAAKNVAQVKSSPILRRVKTEPGVPMQDLPKTRK